jgi:hypothetical protein
VQELKSFMPVEPESLTLLDEQNESNTLKVLGWFSVGMAVAALGIFVGRELRNRYKFKRRTPYDFYSNAGEPQSAEFGMGI